MADTAIPCPSCGTELPEAATGEVEGWPVAHCRACGAAAALCRGPVLCSACGIEFHCEAARLDGGLPVARCPTCGSTAAVRRPDPPPPELKSDVAPLPAPADESAAGRAPPPLPWSPAPWPPAPARPPAADTPAARRARRDVASLVALLYVIACILPTIRFGGQEFQPGILCLLFGWVTCCYWFPNPLLFTGCILLLSGRTRHAFVMGVLACVCTLPLLFGPSQDALRMDLSWGFYVWEADMFLFTLLCALLWRKYGEPSR